MSGRSTLTLVVRASGASLRGRSATIHEAIKSEPRARPKGFFEVPPDLAAEVLSPSDSPRAVLDGVGEYLESGVRLVWVIDPENRRAVVYRSPTETRDIDAGGVLDGEDVLPGFRYTLAELLE